MSVYFITAREVRRVKIGVSADPKKRLKALQTGTPFPLELELVLDGGPDQERGLHRRFAHLRAIGEWFHLGGEIEFFMTKEKSFQRERRAGKLNDKLRREREGVAGDRAADVTVALAARATGQIRELSGGVVQ